MNALSNSDSISFLFECVPFYPIPFPFHFSFQFWPCCLWSVIAPKLIDQFWCAWCQSLAFFQLYMIHLKKIKNRSRKSQVMGVLENRSTISEPHCTIILCWSILPVRHEIDIAEGKSKEPNLVYTSCVSSTSEYKTIKLLLPVITKLTWAHLLYPAGTCFIIYFSILE